MGGSRLHHFFVSGDDDVRISEVLSSTYIGVDASWMMQKYLQEYKSAIRADDCTRAVCEFLQRLDYIEAEDVFVYVVFDGECPPCKRDEARRRELAGGLRRTRVLETTTFTATRTSTLVATRSRHRPARGVDRRTGSRASSSALSFVDNTPCVRRVVNRS